MRQQQANKRDLNLIQSVDRAIVLVETLSNSAGGMSLSVLSRRTGLMPSTAYRLLATLVRRGYLTKNEISRQYMLGPALQVLSSKPGISELRRISYPYLDKLSRTSGETANLAIPVARSVVFIEQVPSNQLVRAVPRLGMQLPIYATAAGKALLAAMSDSGREEFLNNIRLTALTKNTLNTRSALEAVLHGIRRVGYSVDNEEMEAGGKCVAAVVRGAYGQPIAALSITGPATRLTGKRILSLGRLIRSATQVLSEELLGASVPS